MQLTILKKWQCQRFSTMFAFVLSYVEEVSVRKTITGWFSMVSLHRMLIRHSQG